MKRRSRLPFNLILFFSGLVFGIWLGIFFIKGEPVQLIPDFGSRRTPTPVISGQKSLLIIGVDRLNSQEARLQGVWYVAYLPANPELTLIPLYPTINRNLNRNLETAFALGQAFRLNQDFIMVLGDTYNIEWDTHVLLDDFAMIDLIDLLGGVMVDGESQNGSQAVGAIPAAGVDPQGALDGQIAVVRGLCEQTNHLPAPIQLSEISGTTSLHLITQVDLEEAYAAFTNLLESGPSLTCNVIDFRTN